MDQNYKSKTRKSQRIKAARRVPVPEESKIPDERQKKRVRPSGMASQGTKKSKIRSPIIKKKKARKPREKKLNECSEYDLYRDCVKDQRPIDIRKQHIIDREKAIKVKNAAAKTTHDAFGKITNLRENQSLFKLGNLPKESGADVELKRTSPVYSEVTLEKLLPKPEPKIESWNFNNPLMLREQLIGQLKSKVSSENEKFNKNSVECCRKCFCVFLKTMFDPTKICKDCIKFEEERYKIPENLEKYFNADVILGTDKINRESMKPNETKSLIQPFYPCEFESKVKNEPIMKNRYLLPVACLYVAFAESFVNQEDWTSDTIDDILEDGEELYDKSIKSNYKDCCGDFDIIPEISEKSLTLKLCPSCCDGILTSSELNILKGLSYFFNERQACIFQSNDVFLLIWKQCKNFIIFDPNGRNRNCKRDDENGFAAVITTKTLENVCHIIINLSELHYNDNFKLHEIRISNFNDIENTEIYNLTNSTNLKKSKYILTVNNFFGIVPAAIGIDSENFPNDPNISMFISFIAILYSEVDPSKCWTRTIITQLIKYSLQQYQTYKEKNKLKKFHINTLPNVFIMGTFRAYVEKIPYCFSGQIRKCFTFKHSALTQTLRAFFKSHIFGLLQIEESTLAIWCDSKYFYVFDPFRRNKMGEVIDEEQEDEGVACLQIHTNLDLMCRVLYWNSLRMIQEISGNFFLHAFKIKSIDLFNIFTKKTQEIFKIEFPVNCDIKQSDEIKENLLPKEIPDYCLSVLSLTPCQRTCSETEFLSALKKAKAAELRRKRLEVRDSLTSLDVEDEDRVPEYDKEEISEKTAESIICTIMTRIKAREEKRLEKAEQETKKAAKKSEEDEEMLNEKSKASQASNNEISKETLTVHEILEKVRSQVTEESSFISKEDYFKIDEEFLQEKSKEDEIPSNFIQLPDGNGIIFGKNLMKIPESKSDQQKIAILSSITAAVSSNIYSIVTWNKEFIDVFINSGENLYKNSIPQSIIPSLIKGYLPKIEIDSITFDIKTKQLKTAQMYDLFHKLQKNFYKYQQLFILCNTYAAIAFKKNNFFYLFNAYPCDVMGFRTENSGKACFIRFSNLEELVKRINFNRFSNDEIQKFLIMHIVAEKISKRKSKSDDKQNKEDEEIDELLKEDIEMEQEKFKKFRQKLDEWEIEKRKKDKEIKENVKKEEGDEKEKENVDENEKEQKINENDDDDEIISIKPKHKLGRILSDTDPIYEEYQKQIKEIGYHLCTENCQFKIQGTFALENRFKGDIEKIRSCFFVAMYAIMNSIVKPLDQWNFRQVDKILEDGQELFEKLQNQSVTNSREIKNVNIDQYKFNLKIVTVDPSKFRKPLFVALRNIISSKRYFIIQLSNVSFAIQKDEYFHLFDPYAPSQKHAKKNKDVTDNEKETQIENSKKCSKTNVKTISDKNTASWILFSDQETMLKYIEERALSKNWDMEYNIHFIEILSYKKISDDIRMGKISPSKEDFTENGKDPEDMSCLEIEKISWLDNYPHCIPWIRSYVGICSNGKQKLMDVCKRGTFQVEIPDKVYSLWGNNHPFSQKFEESRGKQVLAINVMACCVAQIYRFNEWNDKIIDAIVEYGNEYYQNSISNIKNKNYRLKLEDLDTEYDMDIVNFKIHIEGVFYGILYNINQKELSLKNALIYLFSISRYGIIQCLNKCLALGKGLKGYFLFDCQSRGKPLFKKNEEKPYVLWCVTLQDLLYCLIMTLGIPYHNVYFFIYKTEIDANFGEQYKEFKKKKIDKNNKKHKKFRGKPSKSEQELDVLNNQQPPILEDLATDETTTDKQE